MAKKEGLRKRLSHLFSRSNVCLKEPQKQGTKEDGPRLAAARDPQDGCSNGRRKKRHWKRGAFEGARGEDVRSVCAKHASAESSNSSRPQESRSKARALSYSEPDLWRNSLLRRVGSLNWRKQRSSHVQLSEHPRNPVSETWAAGQLWRPSVGSDADMRSRSERCQPSSQPSETDSAGTSSVPSTSFDSFDCWGERNSWEGSFSISSSSLPCPTAPETKGEALKLPSVQEEISKASEPLPKQAEREIEGALTSGLSHCTAVAEPENLSFGLAQATSKHISGAEEPPTATVSPSVGRPLEVVGAVESSPAKIRYEITITMTKEEEEDRSAGAEPAAGCGEGGLPCHPSEQGTLSLGVAELEKTEEQRHEKPAGLAPRLSACEEFQNCRGPHGVGTWELHGPSLAATTGSPATPQRGSETSPGEGEDRSGTDQLHSVDGTPVEETGLVASESPADSFSESSGISLTTESKAFEPQRARDVRRDLFRIQHSMEKVTGGSRPSQSRSGGSIASTSFKWKKAVPDPPKEEAKPSFSKLPAISQMAERAGIRARANSPSRVSVLLEAWEKGLVGMDTTGSSSSADTRHSRSPVHTRRLLSPQVSSCPLPPANDRSSLSSTDSSADSRQSLSSADTGGSLSPAHPGCPADTQRFHSPSNTKRALSPAETRRSRFPAETRRSHSPAETRRSLSPVDSRRSLFTAEIRRSQSQAETRRSLSPVDSRRSLFTAEIRRSQSQAETRRSLSPVDSRRSLFTAEIRRSRSPAETRQPLSPVDSRRSLFTAERRRSRSPAETRQSLSPVDSRRSLFTAETRRSRSPSDARRSFSPADTRRPFFLADTKGPHSPTDNRHPPSPGNTFSPVESRRPLSPANTRDSCFLKDTQYSPSSAGVQHLSSTVESQCTEDNHHLSSSVDIQDLSSLPDIKSSHSVADIRRVYSSADARHSTSPAGSRHPFSSEENRRSSSPAETRRSFSSADARRSTSPADTRRSFSSEEIRRSTSPAETRRSFSSADARCSTFPGDTRRQFSSEETRRSNSPADTKRSFSSEETRCLTSPGGTRRPFSSEEIRRSNSPADTKRSFSSEENRHSTFPGDTRRQFSSEETRRSNSPADTKRSFSSEENRHSTSPGVTRRPFSSKETRHSASSGDTRRPFSSEETRHSASSGDSRRPFSSKETRHSASSGDTRWPFSSEETRHSTSLAETRRSFPSEENRCLSSLANTGHSFSPGETRHSSSPAETRRAFSPTDARRSPSPAESPTSAARRSRSLSPRRDFTAHGPVFAQVYSPASKPKILLKTETHDATNSTVIAESQGGNRCRGVPTTLQDTGFQKDSHIPSTDGSQEENLPSAAVSIGKTESQGENHMPSGACSTTDTGSPSKTDLLHAMVLRSQTESCSARPANATPSCGLAGGTYTPSALNSKPFGGSSPLHPKPCAVSSSTVAKSQTQWFGPKGGSMVVFRSEQQVIVPQAGSATVYRAGREIIMSSCGAGNASQPQPERPLALSSISYIPPEQNCQVQEDRSDAQFLKEIPAPLPNVCDSSATGPQPESCMTQPRSAGVSDAQRQRCMLVPNPVLTSNGDATTLGEGVVPFSTPQRDCSPYSEAEFQKHSNLLPESRSEREQSMPDTNGPLANGSEQDSKQSRAEEAGATKPQSILYPSDVAAEVGVFGTGSLETAPTDEKGTSRTERRAEQTGQTKVSSVFALEPNVPLAETTTSACELPSQKTRRSNRMAEQEPEEIVEMELFVDTLRNMEPAELRKPLKLHPRPPRPSALAKHAPLPPIHEDHITPKSKVALPMALGVLYALAEERNSEEGKEEPKKEEEDEEDMEEIENPYLSEDEKAQGNNHARELYPWENKSYKTEEEIGSFLGMLQQGPDDLKAKDIAPQVIVNQTNLIRANILKGMSLLSGFVDKKAVEEKPYSRLDNSLLYSRFICPEKSSLKAPEKGKEGRCPPLLLTPSVLKVNQECQTSPNRFEVDEAYEHLSFELPPSGLRAEPSSRAPGANGSSEQMTGLSKEADLLSQPEAQNEEKKLLKKVNMRPGKIILYSESGFEGQKREVWGDITDATSWELSHTISIRVVRGGWVMYEKPRFHGRKCVLAEGDVEITNPWTAYRKAGAEAENTPFHIGSLKRVVRDYRIPEISLFSEENGEGTKWRFTDSAEDTRIHRQPLKAASIIVHSGLWLVYSKPFFDDDPYVLEAGGYPSLEAWGAKDPSICSMHPIKLGCPVVEKPGEPKALVYEKLHFQGLSWEISRDIYNLKKPESNQDSKMSTVGSLKIMGGCWVGYEKEGFRGHQYLLEEGEYCDWTQWGGYNEELVSLRLIRTDFLDPALVLFEAMDFEEGPSVELSEALPDVELASYGTTTQSIHVLSGVWVAYEDKNFTGEQYILEKGVYRNCEDWGATNCLISSVQPILQVGEHSLHFVSKIQLFSDPDFSGTYVAFTEDQASLPENFIPHSCRVNGGSWILYDGQKFDGEQHILSEGEYPTLTSMGCLFTTDICSLKKVPIFFSEPSIFLHGLECFEGKEIELNGEVRSLQAEGFNNHVLSIRVKGGIWVLCEHSDFRGRQWLLDCVEITNWVTYSGLQHVGSLYPIRQKRIYFRIKNEELKTFLSVPDDVEDMKASRVLVSELNDKSSSIWYYEEGLMKNQVAPIMSLQVIGPAGKGTKVVLWSESRVPRQTWRIDSFGRICSQMFEDKLLDVKGGRAYDRDHAILWDSSEERPTQIWAVQVL